ncbi:MAG: thiamine phosphate synthase [Alphaproteobacteria bacterium]|nr:MAG: thiamine phosphate synthase [Alphaproteobacteria bacterium]
MIEPINERATLTRCARWLNSRAPSLPPMWFMTDQQRAPDPSALVARLPRGTGVIFRHYDDPMRDSVGRELRRLCGQQNRMFLVAGDALLAQRLRADGLHVPEHQLPILFGLRHRHPRWLVTASAHNLPAALMARRAGADALIIAPVLPTVSHRHAACLGRIRFTGLVHQVRLPAYALGGIYGTTIHQLLASGAVGIAGIGAFMDGPSS